MANKFQLQELNQILIYVVHFSLSFFLLWFQSVHAHVCVCVCDWMMKKDLSSV